MTGDQERRILGAARRSALARLSERKSQVPRSLGDGHSGADR
ncbi:MAG: hypothetical protein ABIQ59_02400 [Nocardioidaceae bacterium]